MRERKDLEGQRFGRLKVISCDEPSRKGRRIHCVCDCGKKVTVWMCNLLSGSTKSCGCLQTDHCKAINHGRKHDLTGWKFGLLTAFEPAVTDKGIPGWRCSCDCGKEIVLPTCSLTSGRTRSCGCLRSQNAVAQGMKRKKYTPRSEMMKEFGLEDRPMEDMMGRQLAEYAHSEAMDVSEEIAEGEVINYRARILEAARFYRQTFGAESERLDAVIDAIETAFQERHIPIQ